MHASVVAHPNIALVKYWGKRDSRLNLPAAGSLSLTLGPVATRTSLTFGAEEDSLELNGVAVPAAKRLRVATLLDRVRDLVALEQGPAARAALGGARILSTNDFPTAAGLASSSSGFAALALAATEAAGLHLSLPQLSALAREGSGSAARSLFGGFARMHAGTRADGTDAFAEPLFDEHHWDLRVVIAVTVEGEKEVASTDGMNLTERTSPYYPAWIETVEPDVQSAMTAIALATSTTSPASPRPAPSACMPAPSLQTQAFSTGEAPRSRSSTRSVASAPAASPSFSPSTQAPM